eukprot:993817-Prorocentrum_minimum.AAC.1
MSGFPSKIRQFSSPPNMGGWGEATAYANSPTAYSTNKLTSRNPEPTICPPGPHPQRSSFLSVNDPPGEGNSQPGEGNSQPGKEFTAGRREFTAGEGIHSREKGIHSRGGNSQPGEGNSQPAGGNVQRFPNFSI